MNFLPVWNGLFFRREKVQEEVRLSLMGTQAERCKTMLWGLLQCPKRWEELKLWSSCSFTAFPSSGELMLWVVLDIGRGRKQTCLAQKGINDICMCVLLETRLDWVKEVLNGRPSEEPHNGHSFWFFRKNTCGFQLQLYPKDPGLILVACGATQISKKRTPNLPEIVFLMIRLHTLEYFFNTPRSFTLSTGWINISHLFKKHEQKH